nr:stage 0 sporulation family protein [Deinococcota bacterium]
MPECIGVRFDNGPKIHYVEAPPSAPGVGVRCIVSTRRGLELALVRTEIVDQVKPTGHYVRPVQAEDEDRWQALGERAEDLKWLLRAKARESGANMKLLSLEFTLDESLLVVNYSAEEQVPLRVLAQVLMNHTAARIEFNNVGPRDQSRILGAIGVCGAESCCSTWLQSFTAVSIRMARDQQLPLNPEKISGPCGRLMCCLQYEHPMYQELIKEMPKKGSKGCHTSGSCGRVVKLNPLKGTVEMMTDEGAYEEHPAAEITRQSRNAAGT